jgi:hypothetical protein
MTRREILYRITEYLSVGGLFNPEMVTPQDAVRDLIMECREILERSIVLTPDDILTLKEGRDEYKQALFSVRGDRKDYRSWQRMLETLERILKQVG